MPHYSMIFQTVQRNHHQRHAAFFFSSHFNRRDLSTNYTITTTTLRFSYNIKNRYTLRFKKYLLLKSTFYGQLCVWYANVQVYTRHCTAILLHIHTNVYIRMLFVDIVYVTIPWRILYATAMLGSDVIFS